jgi:parvulin-like peptidyl-prolyl isomerase
MNRFTALTLLVILSLSAAALAVEKPNEAVLATTAAMAFKYQDYGEAAAAYQKLLEAFPKSVQVKDYTYHLAMSLERLGDTQKAAEMYQDVVTKHKGKKSNLAGIDSLAMEGVGRCFNKNFKEYAVVINGQPITKLEVDAELEKVPPFYRGQFDSEEGRRKFLQQLIERKLLMAEAMRLGVANKPEVHARLEETRQNVLIRALIDQEVSQKAQPTEAEIKKHYKENQKDFTTPDQVKARMIAVASKAKAEEIYREAVKKKGLPFDSLAKLHSTDPSAKSGGDLGLVSKGQRPELEAGLFTLAKGKIGKPVPIESKFAIVKLEAKEGKKLHLKWIVVKTMAEATKLLEALQADAAGFDSLARKNSIDPSKDKGGDLGLVAKGEVEEAVFAAAARLKPGAYTRKPVELHTKFAVFKVEDKIPSSIKPLDQVRGQISGNLARERQKAVYEKYMEDLKARAKIEYPAEPAQPEK